VNCHELVELITDYLEGAMSQEMRARVDEHLVDCDGCTAFLDQFRTTIRVTGRLTEDQVSPDARESLLQVFRGRRSL
jgi:predicted anti-sigma-YlaC factor YlaD